MLNSKNSLPERVNTETDGIKLSHKQNPPIFKEKNVKRKSLPHEIKHGSFRIYPTDPRVLINNEFQGKNYRETMPRTK